MYRVFLLLVCFSVLFSSGFVYAQEDGSGNADMAKRIELAQKMHDIWPTREKVENAILYVSRNVPPAERQNFVKAMEFSIDYAAIEGESIKTMAETFSLEELTAMLDYYGSESGQSAESKRDDYIEKLRPRIETYVDKAFTEYRYGKED